MGEKRKNQSELYMDHIVESLVKHKASILVGDGFSRNALPRNESVNKSMPLWNELTNQFYDLLDLDGSKEYLSPLTIAQEVEEMYDRPKLDALIMSAMNDEHFRPTPIYSDLLALNWNNIFTTNYDRLLEWALDQYDTPNYVVIRDEKDLLLSSKAQKIIKLHGSFPSNGPYIITEEDYRTYPKKHAIFVNTVQQALIEDTFCLIGFSGTDPNFLNWIGWIHDNLGIENSPLIYMIVDNEKSKAETKNLLCKKIGLVILDDLEGYKGLKTSEKYEKFIVDLKKRVNEKEDAFKDWNQIAGKQVHYETGKEKNDFEKLKDEEELYKELKTIHEQYPGWIFLPHTEINKVKKIIDNIDKYFDDKGTKHFLIEICFEYCWLHEISGTLIYNDQRLEMVVKEYLEVDHDSEKNDYIQHILIQLLRCHRYEFEYEKWKECLKLFDHFEQKSRDISNALAYEKVLFHIYSFDFDDALKCISTIQLDSVPDIWSMRKAALLATFGKYGKSLAMLVDYLKRCHNILNKEQSVHDFYYSSVESCGFYLYQYIKQNYNQSKELEKSMNEKENCNNYTKNDSDELKDTKEHPKIWQYDFIWREENDLYLNEILQKCQRESKLKHGFDGDYTSVYIVPPSDEGFEVAIRFLAFREMTAIPFKIGMTTSKYGVLNVAKHLRYYYPQQPLVLATIAGESKIIEQVFTKYYLSQLKTSEAESLFDICYKVFVNAFAKITTNDIEYYQYTITEYPLEIMLEVLSRLASRCSIKHIKELRLLIIDLYKLHDLIRFNASKAIKRIINAIPLKKLETCIDTFCDLPLMREGYIEYSSFPDCISLTALKFDEVQVKVPMNSKVRKRFNELIKKCDNNFLKKAAINRLVGLSKIFTLDDNQKVAFDNIIFENDNNGKLDEYLSYFYDISVINDSQFLTAQWQSMLHSLADYSSDNNFSTGYATTLHKGNFLVEKVSAESINLDDFLDTMLTLCAKLSGLYKLSLTHETFLKEAIIEDLNLASTLIGKALLRKKYPKVEENKQSAEEYLEKIIKIMKECNCPHSLINFSVNKSSFLQDLSDQLQKTNNQDVVEACKTILLLCNDLEEHELYGLVDIIIEHLYGGIDDQMGNYVSVLSLLVEKGKISDKKQIDNICRCLDRLNRISAYTLGNPDLTNEKIRIRRACTSLAFNLYSSHKTVDNNLDKGIEAWKRLSSDNNEFTEVKNVWIDLEYRSLKLTSKI